MFVICVIAFGFVIWLGFPFTLCCVLWCCVWVNLVVVWIACCLGWFVNVLLCLFYVVIIVGSWLFAELLLFWWLFVIVVLFCLLLVLMFDWLPTVVLIVGL